MNTPSLKILVLILFGSLLFATLAVGHGNGNTWDFTENENAECLLMDKITFQVDTRNITVDPSGMFIAGSFFSTIGLPNWTFLPMCDLGSGIWEISFVDIPPGTYQYKFVNGNAPPGWEFDGFGGPCTNPADNNNRWLNYGGGMHLEGPHCFDTCDSWCSGYGDPGVSDTEPPSIDESVPADITIDCGDPLPASLGLAASDGCDVNATMTTGPPTDDNSGLNACGVGDIIRTWTATDCAGNETTVSQIITLIDVTPPVIIDPLPPDSIFLVCHDNFPPAFQLAISDACDPTVLYTNVITDGAGIHPVCRTGIGTRTWEGVDCSGNQVSHTQYVVFEDNDPPTITEPVPADVTVECEDVPPANALSAMDNCDHTMTDTGLPTDDLSGLNACGTGTFTRTWEVEDCDDNITTVSQNITLTDNTPPVINGLPADITVACGSVPAAVSVNASDGCDNSVTATGLPTDDVSGLGSCGTGQLIRTWQVTDCSGNMTSASQTITIEDNTGPVIDEPVPPPITIDCSSPLPPGNPLAASDACDVGISQTALPVDDLSGLGNCGVGQVTRTWTVTDCAGNETNVSQTINVTDTQGPLIQSIPPNITVSCNDIPPPAPLAATDDCDGDVTSTGLPIDDSSGMGICGTGEIIRTWSAVDCSGNLTTAAQIIAVVDPELPIIVDPIPLDTVVSCGSVPAPFPLAATDICDGNVVTTGPPVDDVSTLNSCGVGDMVRTWSVSDCTGNIFTAFQIITIEDSLPPVLAIPADVTYSCGNVPPASANDASATDNCSPATVFYDGETTVGNSCPFEIHRTWTAVDECGNSISETQIVSVFDTELPIFQNVPADLTVCAGVLPPMIDLEWTDNCDGNGTVTGSDLSDGMTNPETITRTWTYTDACNNVGTATQLITVQEGPAADAGADQTVCEGNVIAVSGSVTGGFSAVLWTTNGDGSFADETNATTTYTPGTNDLVNNAVTLTFTATISAGDCDEAIDSLLLTLIDLPVADAGMDQTITCGVPNVILDGNNSSSGAGYAYSWSGPGIHAGNMDEQSPMVSLPGVYVLIVTELNSGENCSATSNVEVFENTILPEANAGADLLLTCSQTTVLLDGSGNAGGAAFTYTWAGPGITAANDSLPDPAVSEAGLYVLTITNAENGCTNTDEMIVSLDSGLPNADAGPNQTIDCLVSTVVLDGGNSSSGSGITYQWFDPSGNPLGTGLTQTATLAGIYAFTVNDTNNGCSITATVEVVLDNGPPTADAGPDFSLTCDQPSTVLGGTSSQGLEFAYEWILGGAVQGDEITLITSQPGIYTLNIVNTVNGCTASDQVEVFENADAPAANAGMDLMLDCNNSLVVLDGTGSSTGTAIIYQWSGPGFSSNEINPPVSSAGNYVLVVSDTINNCSATDSVLVTAAADLPIAAAGTDTTLTCIASQLLLDGSGSTQNANIVYQWTDQAGNVLGDDLGLLVGSAGTYILQVIDTITGCSALDEISVSIDTLPPVANAGQDLTFTCAQTTVTLDGTGSSVGIEFSYLWSGPGIVGDSTSITVEAVETGIYTLMITDENNGCTTVDQAEILQDADVPTAFAGPDQTITCLVEVVNLQGSASVSQVIYQWSGPGINAANENLPAPEVNEPGLYNLVVTDLLTGCASPPASVTVDDGRILPTAQIMVSSDLDCQNTAVLLDGNNSSLGNEFNYQWHFNNQPINGANAISWLAENAGQYVLEVVNGITGCVGVDTVEVLDNTALPPAAIGGLNQLTCLQNSIQLVETMGFNLPAVTISWSTIGGNITATSTSPPAIELDEAGLYIVAVTDLSNGCVNTDTFAVMENFAAPVIVFNQLFELGCVAPGVILEAQVSATTNDLSYLWTGANFSSTEIMPTVSVAGGYELTVTNMENGCSAVGNVFVTQTEGITGIAYTVDSPACAGEPGGSVTVESVDGFNPPYDYSLDGVNFSETPLFGDLETGMYVLTVRDNEGCELELDFSIGAGLPVFLDLGDDLQISLGDSIQLSPVTTANFATYDWSPAITLSCPDCPEPIARPVETTTYSLIATTATGCEAIDDLTIFVDPMINVYLPNAFSPNGDGINDFFTVYGGAQVVGIKSLLIFDRWGAKIFHGLNLPLNQVNVGWDGTHLGQLMDAGVYTFFTEVELVDGRVELLKGDVVLVR